MINMITHRLTMDGTIYGPEYGQPGAIYKKLGYRSQLKHTLMKLLDIPQPKCQYNRKLKTR